MTAASTIAAALRSGRPGGTVDCDTCGVSLRPVDDVDEDVALGTFLQHHPASPEAVHRLDVPAGWSPVTVLPD